MRISVNIKPKKITGNTKKELMQTINKFHMYTVTGSGNYLASYYHKDMIRVFNVEKRRKKVELRTKNGKLYHQIVSPNHWVGFIYDIPFNVVETMNLKIQQYHRHFRIDRR